MDAEDELVVYTAPAAAADAFPGLPRVKTGSSIDGIGCLNGCCAPGGRDEAPRADASTCVEFGSPFHGASVPIPFEVDGIVVG